MFLSKIEYFLWLGTQIGRLIEDKIQNIGNFEDKIQK